MKKLILLPVALISAFAFGQKPQNGTITTEVGVAASGFWSPVSSFGLNGRYFLNSGLALNLGFMMMNGNDEAKFYENSDGSGKSGTYKTKSSGTMFNLGIQKHFAGNERLSPFVALGFGFGSGKETEEGDNSDGDDFIDNYSTKVEGSSSMMNISLGLGFDYWFGKGLYIGVQYNPISWNSFNDKDITTTTNGKKFVEPGVKSSMVSTFGATPLFRLGWRFN